MLHGGGNQLDKCVMCGGEYLVYNILVGFFVVICSKKKERKERECKVSHLLYYCSWCGLFCEMVRVKNVVINQGIFYLVDWKWKWERAQVGASFCL